MSELTINRRKYQRHTLSVKLNLTRVDDTSGNGIPIEVLDISRVGIGFICDEPLNNGVIYRADIRIWTGDTITAFINVVRVSHEKGSNIYGGVFIGMSESDSCRIGVYETYLQQQSGVSSAAPAKTEEEEKEELISLLDQALSLDMFG